MRIRNLDKDKYVSDVWINFSFQSTVPNVLCACIKIAHGYLIYLTIVSYCTDLLELELDIIGHIEIQDVTMKDWC